MSVVVAVVDLRVQTGSKAVNSNSNGIQFIFVCPLVPLLIQKAEASQTNSYYCYYWSYHWKLNLS